jgi:IclR family transcriptional regulator, acetate operon repressor
MPLSTTSQATSSSSSVERSLEILRVLASAEEDLSLQRIAHSVNLHTSTTHRLLATLIKQGFVDQRSDLRYRLGLEAFVVGSGFLRRSVIRRAAIPFLMKLSEQTGLTVNFGVWNKNAVAIIDCIPAPGMAQFYETGSLAPLHATALGKALLAFRPETDAPLYGENDRYIRGTKGRTRVHSGAKIRRRRRRVHTRRTLHCDPDPYL